MFEVERLRAFCALSYRLRVYISGLLSSLHTFW